jgi:hypothetical protein
MHVASRYQSPQGFQLKDKASGLYLHDARSDFAVIAVSQEPHTAISFPTEKAAHQARSMVGALFGSFDWRVVEA